MVETTLGLVSFNLKRKVLQAVKDSQLLVIFDKSFELTREQAQDVLKKDIKESKIPVYAFVLEGQNAVKEWLNVIDRLNTTNNYILYGRSNPKEIQRNVIWLKSLERPSNISISKKKIQTRTTTSSEVTPIKKSALPRAQINNTTKRIKPGALQKKEGPSKTTNIQKKVHTKRDTAITKESKSETTKELKKTTKSATTQKLTVDKTISETRIESEEESMNDHETQTVQEATVDTATEIQQEIVKEIEEPEPKTDKETHDQTILIVSHPSTCSSATADDYDAEIFRVTNKKHNIDSSIISPRPGTPEVNQLRSKFEQIIQKEKQIPVAAVVDKSIRPQGSRVKTMVEMFMDENFNKWEF